MSWIEAQVMLDRLHSNMPNYEGIRYALAFMGDVGNEQAKPDSLAKRWIILSVVGPRPLSIDGDRYMEEEFDVLVTVAEPVGDSPRNQWFERLSSPLGLPAMMDAMRSRFHRDYGLLPLLNARNQADNRIQPAYRYQYIEPPRWTSVDPQPKIFGGIWINSTSAENNTGNVLALTATFSGLVRVVHTLTYEES